MSTALRSAPARAARVVSDADFQKFREFFYRKTGIHFDDNKRYFVDKRLVDRMEATGAADFREYFVALRFEREVREDRRGQLTRARAKQRRQLLHR